MQRAVDAAAIAAATQIREAQPLSAIGPFANQFITLNNTDTATVIVQQRRRQSGVTSVDEFNGLDNSITNYALADLQRRLQSGLSVVRRRAAQTNPGPSQRAGAIHLLDDYRVQHHRHLGRRGVRSRLRGHGLGLRHR